MWKIDVSDNMLIVIVVVAICLLIGSCIHECNKLSMTRIKSKTCGCIDRNEKDLK